MAQHVVEGDLLLEDEEYEKAIESYSKAIEQAPNNAQAYEARAKARIALEEFEDALQDATNAVELDPQFAKAYLQQGVAYFKLEEYEAAKATFEKGHSLAPTIDRFKKWIRKCQAELDDEAGHSAVPTTSSGAPAPTTASTKPVVAAAPKVPKASATPTSAAPAAPAQTTAVASSSAAGEASATAPLAPAAALPVFQGKYRHQHYQIQDKVVVDVYAKNLPKDRVSVTFEADHLLIIIKDSDGAEEYRLDVPLYGKIIPEQSRTEVLRSKVEITMQKADRTAWATLEQSDKLAAPNFSDPEFHNPSYPTSYTKAPKDWGSVEAELKAQEEKGELEFGDPLNNFFKKIYGQGSEEQRRAMMKSFQESNGTVLSTNWEEVGQKPVECTPPDGMELKKYEM